MDIPVEFPIIFDNVSEQISDTLTKKRARIFYKGLNRNGGYIDDEFAEKLIQTLDYAPVKGIYNEFDGDFEDHGKARTEGRIYGIVPKEKNFSWESHLDDDGITRDYATCDVILFTALYPEANEIAGKGQSMELFGPSITGEWINIDGTKVFKYKTASFLGLQVLGDDITPCFEGAGFFQLSEEIISGIYSAILDKLGGKVQMNNENLFSLSDKQKCNILFDKLNEDGQCVYIICESYDDYVIVFNCDEEKYYKVNFEKEEDDVEIVGEMVQVYPEFITEEEKQALNTIRAMTEIGNYCAAVDKINELNAELGTSSETISTYEAQLHELNEYKKNIENQEKNAILDKYSMKLDEEVITSYRNKLDSYSTIVELDKDLAYELVNANQGLFELDERGIVPQETELSGVEALLSKYKKK